jgi:hypothetical protein
MPQGINRVQNLTVGFAGLVLMLWVGPSWGEHPPGNDTSGFNANIGSGTDALVNITTGIGQFNTAFGTRALEKTDDGSRNTASGFFALRSNTKGSNNTASGASALQSNIDGDQNTASGSGALQGNTTGSANTASGGLALSSNISGSANTAVGRSALTNNIGGDFNTAIGESAGSQLKSGDHNIYLGHKGVAAESKTMRLGGGEIDRTFSTGIFNKSVAPSGTTVFIDANGQLGTIITSSARYKRDIQDMGARSRGVFQLRPVTFRYTQDSQGVLQYGLIAEEVAAVYPELVVRGTDGTVEGVQYHALIPLLLNELQHQQHQLSAQSQQLAQLNAQNEDLRATLVQQNAELAARLARLEEAAARTATLTSR